MTGINRLLFISLFLCFLLIFILLIDWLVDISFVSSVNPKDLSEIIRNYTLSAAAVIGGTIGIVLAWKRTLAAGKNADAALTQAKRANEVHFTHVFSEAVNQLSNDQPLTRMAGIHSLGRLAGEFHSQHWVIMKLLCSFIRERSPACKILDEDGEVIKFRTDYEIGDFPPDVQAALDVLGSREIELDHRDEELTIIDCDLYGARLSRLDFSNFLFASSNLGLIRAESAKFIGSTIIECNLEVADFLNSDLSAANLGRPTSAWRFRLARANLYKTSFGHIDFDEVSFADANFSDTEFKHVDLKGAHYFDYDEIKDKCIFYGINEMPNGEVIENSNQDQKAELYKIRDRTKIKQKLIWGI